VVIESGALSGLRGVLIECKGVRRLVVSVRLLQRSVAVEIDKESVRPGRRRAGVDCPVSCHSGQSRTSKIACFRLESKGRVGQ